MSTWHRFENDGVALAALDFGGSGAPVVFLHGLAGHAGEWSETASWLTDRHRVVALDARGHGRSQLLVDDVSPGALVSDVVRIIESLLLGEVVLVGQSIGASVALLVAARHPQLVRGLILLDGAPSDGGHGQEAATSIQTALRSWPVPFPSRDAAESDFRERFGAGAAGPWAAGLEQAADGWRPRFDVEVMSRTLAGMHGPSAWADWEAIICPVLVIRAGRGVLNAEVVAEMAARLPGTETIEFPGSEHDIHLDAPEQWRTTLTTFLERIGRQTP